ncbi:MAG: alanine racemase [Muribaculaceae bacterium]|nr:alanine racemase [Muribaculaceae bacterium]
MTFSINDICRVTGGISDGTGEVTNMVFDTRSVRKPEGTMFCAIRTASADGHRYIQHAYASGIRMFLVEQRPEDSCHDAVFVIVDSVTEALERLAAEARARIERHTVIGITGSRGKTIVKEMLFNALKAVGQKVWRSPRSWNSRLGVPVSLINAPENADIYIFEAGIDSTGGMEPLESMIRPNFGIMTSITDAHSSGFSNLSEKIAEKALLFKNCAKIVADNSEPLVGYTLLEACPDASICLTDGRTPAERNIAVTEGAMSALGYPDTDLSELPQPDNRIDVFQGVNNCLVLLDRFTPDTQSLEEALDFMHRRMIAGRTNTVITTADAASDPQNAELFARYGITRIIPADDTFFDNFDSADFQGETILIAGGASELFDNIRNSIESPRHDTVFEINLNSIIHNINYYRSLLAPGTGIVGMVKAQGYGTGALEVAKTLQAQGADYLAVAVIDEGVELRRGGITMPVMVLNPVTSNYGAMFRHNLEPSVFSLPELRLLARKARHYGIKNFKAHVKLDTGMHRVGFTPDEIPELIEELRRNPEIHVASIFSHLATADCPDQEDYTRLQLDTFKDQSERLVAALPYPVRRHILNTAGIQTHPDHHYDMVRLGIGLYGVSPVPVPSDTLATVATLKSTIISLRHWPAGTTIGYGRRGVLNRDSVIATVAIGYADGINRHLGRGNASFIVDGVACPTVGNICMDQLMIDVTDVPDVKVGDEVEIYGTRQPVEHLAEILDTIPYELIATVSPRVARIYYND